MILKGIKIRLELNNKQRTLAFQHAGVSRHAYNWGVNLCSEISKEKGKLPSSIDMHKLLVRDVKSVNKWYYDVSKCAPQEALRCLYKSYSNFFRQLKNGEVEKKKKAYVKERKSKGLPIKNDKLFNLCKPKFKKKGVNDSFYLEGNIQVKGNKIKLPVFGWVKMSEHYDTQFSLKNVVISRQSDYFFVSFKKETGDLKIKGIEKKPSVGVDIGISTLATMSDGSFVDSIKAYKKSKRKLKLAQRIVSKRYNEKEKEQSKNYKKSKEKVARIHYKISCIRKDSTHKLTTSLAKNHSLIGIEDLHVKGMMKNHKLASAISDGGFYEFRRQLEYKTKWYGSELVVIDRYFPSSKKCSCCGNIKKDLKLSQRIYNCESCGLSIDRDLNAAINIRNEAVSSIASVCGEVKKSDIISETSAKQKINRKIPLGKFV